MSNIITDAELVAQYAAKAMEEPAKVIATKAPSDSEVRLPGGFINSSGEVVTKAEVKELDGTDEEAISKSGSTAKSLHALLQRGLLKLGGADVTKDDLDTLLSGDRDAILLGIRRVTFGSTINLRALCSNCNEGQDVTVSLDEDVPVKTLDNPIQDRVWDMETKKGTVRVALPNGVVQRKLMDNIDKTTAEVNTILLSGCIISLNGATSIGAGTALSLGMAERSKIVEEIVKRNPGPRLGEVTKPCKACGEAMPLPLSLLDLFRV